MIKKNPGHPKRLAVIWTSVKKNNTCEKLAFSEISYNKKLKII